MSAQTKHTTTSRRGGSSAVRWDESMIQAWERSRPVIHARLAVAGKTQDLEDVMQKTWIAADSSLESFDEALGSFLTWIKGVADKQALKHLAGELSKSKAADKAAQVSASGAVTPFDTTMADPAVVLGDCFDAINRVGRVMVILREVIGHVPVLLERSMHLVLPCDGDVEMAARRLGVRPEALRDSHRHILDLAQVIDKAIDTWWTRRETGRAGGPVSARELFGCLPSAGAENREWITVIAKASVITGGFRKITPRVLAEGTGWSETYCRHGLSRTTRLVDVALPVIQHGGLEPGAAEPVAVQQIDPTSWMGSELATTGERKEDQE